MELEPDKVIRVAGFAYLSHVGQLPAFLALLDLA